MQVIDFQTRDASVKAKIDFDALPEKTREAIIVYGVRRWFQDYMNSQAKIDRDAGNTPNMQALFDKRLEMATTGNFGQRGPATTGGIDAFEAEILTKHWKVWSKIKTFSKKKADWLPEVRAELMSRKGGEEDYATFIAAERAKHEAEMAELMAELEE